jgi:hypothetical protein
VPLRRLEQSPAFVSSSLYGLAPKSVDPQFLDDPLGPEPAGLRHSAEDFSAMKGLDVTTLLDRWPPDIDGHDAERCAQWDRLIERLVWIPERKTEPYDPSAIVPIFSQKLVILITENYAATDEPKKLCLYREKLANFQGELATLHGEMLRNPDWSKRMRYVAADGLMEYHLFAVERAARPDGWAIPEDRKIRNLILEGSGVRGVAYLTALKILLDPLSNGDLIDSSRLKINGTSSGGLAAVAAALCLDNMESIYEEIIHSVSAGKCSEETKRRFARHYPSLRLDSSPVSFNTLELVEHFDWQISKKVQDWLRINFRAGFGSIPQLNGVQIARLRKLQAGGKNGRKVDESREEKMITFGDLALLRSIGAPFHDLALMLTDESTYQVIYADAAYTPDLPIVYALRGTIAYPVLFEECSLPARLLAPAITDDGRWHVIGDGSTCVNTPLDSNDGLNPQQRLILTFDKNGSRKIRTAAVVAPIEAKRRPTSTGPLQKVTQVSAIQGNALQKQLRKSSTVDNSFWRQLLDILVRKARMYELLEQNMSRNHGRVKLDPKVYQRHTAVLPCGSVGLLDLNSTERQRRGRPYSLLRTSS